MRRYIGGPRDGAPVSWAVGPGRTACITKVRNRKGRQMLVEHTYSLGPDGNYHHLGCQRRRKVRGSRTDAD